MAQQGQLNVKPFTKVLVSDIKAKDTKLHQILQDLVNAKVDVPSAAIADDQTPPHYWSLSVSNGTIVLTDLGTTKP
jgi:hypothetical protein